jgi:flagellar biosynthesis protein FlhB
LLSRCLLAISQFQQLWNNFRFFRILLAHLRIWTSRLMYFIRLCLLGLLVSKMLQINWNICFQSIRICFQSIGICSQSSRIRSQFVRDNNQCF